MATRRVRIALAIATVVAASVSPATQTLDPVPVTGDIYYYYGETRVYLDAAASDIVIGFDQAGGADAAQTIKSLLPSAELGVEVRARDRSYRVVTMASRKNLTGVVAGLKGVNGVEFAAPVYRLRDSRTRLLPTNEIIVKIRGGSTLQSLAAIAASRNLAVDRPVRGSGGEFVLRVPADGDAVSQARLLHESGLVEWAEPNFLREFRRSAAPNDPRFEQQWHLRNTGQGAGAPGADIKAPEAWDIESGAPSVVIAIVDDGVDVNHEDLAPNIFVNAAEIPDNGFDDDRNGYIDDVRGWDFAADDNDPSPTAAGDNHGTAVAGVAAARGGNAIGVSGVCPGCRILPVKIVGDEEFVSMDRVAEGLRYAADHADVINNSWGISGPSNALQSALEYARWSGRAGLGSVVVSAAGNGAGGNVELVTSSPLRAGTHRFRWTYSKDDTVTSGADAAWLATVAFPGGEVVHFENGPLPDGWQTGGASPWASVVDPEHADEGSCVLTSLQSGRVGASQSSYLEVVKTVPAGHLYTLNYVSSEEGFDGLRLEIDLDNNGTTDLRTGLVSGLPPAAPYPAASSLYSMSVGASSNFDCRSHFSQFWPDFLAPGSAGVLNLGIHTTDRTGFDGYGTSNYVDDFGGTSSATPVAAGIAGLLLSRNPELRPSSVRQLLTDNADQIGGVTYVNGWHVRYGAGRLNAARALAAAPLPSNDDAPEIRRHPASQFVPSGGSARLSVSATGPSLTYQWYRGASGDQGTPVAGANGPVFDTPASTESVSYWVRVANPFGAVNSLAARLDVSAAFDSVLGVPRCASVGSVCDSGWLLVGRGPIEPEPNFPNALHEACGDGSGANGVGRIDRIRVSSTSAAPFAAGALVLVEIETVTSLAPGYLELSFSSTPSAPRRIAISTLRAPFAGPYTFSTTYLLPPGAVQTLHARLYQVPRGTDWCGTWDDFVDSDDLVFASTDVASPPQIREAPAPVYFSYPIPSYLSVGATGSSPLTYQWYRGTSGDTTDPLPGATGPRINVTEQLLRGTFWVRVSNPFGTVDSASVESAFYVSTSAAYDPVLRVPRCSTPSTSCNSGSLLNGRGPVGPELNHPNTLFGSCQDGTAGLRGSESVESISVYSLDGSPAAPGKRVQVWVNVVGTSLFFDAVDLYYAADATSPVWTHLTTVRIDPSSNVARAEYVLPHGPLQAVRARVRYHGSPSPCGAGGAGSYDDHDDLVFATDSSPTMPPLIVSQPASQTSALGELTSLGVTAVGAGLSYQWYAGVSGDTSQPIAGATTATFAVAPPAGITRYWVRVTGGTGAIDSAHAAVTVVQRLGATYSSRYSVPICASWSAWCDSGPLLIGRSVRGPEPNYPNARFCDGDGFRGTFHVDESIDRMQLSTLSGNPFAAGETVRIEVTAWIFSHTSDVLEIYHSPSADVPTWTLVATLSPTGPGAQTFLAGVVLPPGPVQSVRARLRYKGEPGACDRNGLYDDHDDLAIAVGGDTTLLDASPTTFDARDAAPVLAASPTAIWPGMLSPQAARRSDAREQGASPDEIEQMREVEPDSVAAAYRDRDLRRLEEESAAPISDPTPASSTSVQTPSGVQRPAEALSSSFGAPRAFTLRFRANAPSSIRYAEVWFSASPALGSARSCMVYLERASNTWLLVSDDGRELLTVQGSGSNTLTNGQCSVDLAAVNVQADDAGVTINMTLRFRDGYERDMKAFTQTVNEEGSSSGWATVPPAPAIDRAP